MFLMALVVFLGIKAYDAWSDGERRLPEASETKKKHPEPAKETVVVSMASADISAYQGIVNNNLFSVSRAPDDITTEEKPPEPDSTPEPDPRLLKILEATLRQISIYGIMIDGEEKKALLEGPLAAVSDDNLGSKLPRLMKNQRSLPGRETKWVKVGEPVNRFKVKEITPVGMTLSAEGLEFDVILYDETKPKKREPEKTVAGPVVIDTSKEAKAVRPEEDSEKTQTKPPEKSEAPKIQATEKTKSTQAQTSGKEVRSETEPKTSEPVKLRPTRKILRDRR